jgi:hypothetical protein
MGNYLTNNISQENIDISHNNHNINKINWYIQVYGPTLTTYTSKMIKNASKYNKWFQYEKRNNNLENIRKKYQDELDNLLILQESPDILQDNRKMAKYYNKLNYDKYIEYIQELSNLEILTTNKIFKDKYNLEYKKIINKNNCLIDNYNYVNSFLQKQEQYYQDHSYKRVKRRIIRLQYILSLIDKIIDNI